MCWPRRNSSSKEPSHASAPVRIGQRPLALGEAVSMTYCVGMLVEDGLALIGDTRTSRTARP